MEQLFAILNNAMVSKIKTAHPPPPGHSTKEAQNVAICVCCNCEKAVLELDTFLMKSFSLEQLGDIKIDN